MNRSPASNPVEPALTAAAVDCARVGNGVVLAIVLTGFVACTYGFGVYLFANLLVDMRRDIGFDYTAVGLITGGAQIGFLGFSFLAGYLSRFVAGWKISLYSTVATSLALLGLSVSDSIGLSAGLLILLGGCSASAYVPLAEIVATHFPVTTRARVMGLISSGTSYGVFINGVLVSVLTLHGGWRAIWMIAGLLSVMVCVAAWYLLRHSPDALQSQPATSQPGATQSWLSVPLYLTWLVAFLNGLTLLPFQTYLAPFMREELSMSVATTGMVWSTIGAVGMAAGFLVGWVADRVGSRRALMLCFVSACLASLCVYYLDSDGGFYLAGFLFALAFYPVFGLVPTYLGQIVPLDCLTRAFGIANVLIGVGGVLGNFLGGICKELLGSFAPLYLCIAGLLLVQLMVVALLPDKPPDD
ncbi:MFS transporter [Pseudomonas sp. DSP3-2-2]|uniref:MFS transporter n=1 Tax=unclassified Pseudomonas TaxID=196821 RepID=UPI003CF8D92B